MGTRDQKGFLLGDSLRLRSGRSDHTQPDSTDTSLERRACHLLQPSEVLEGYFQACDEDLTSEVVTRVEELSNNILPAVPGPSSIACMQSSLAKERKLEVGDSSPCWADLQPFKSYGHLS